MKTLTIHCIECNDTFTFQAINTAMLIRLIDNAGWQEHGWEKKRMSALPKGHMPGKCEQCLVNDTGTLDSLK